MHKERTKLTSWLRGESMQDLRSELFFLNEFPEVVHRFAVEALLLQKLSKR